MALKIRSLNSKDKVARLSMMPSTLITFFLVFIQLAFLLFVFFSENKTISNFFIVVPTLTFVVILYFLTRFQYGVLKLLQNEIIQNAVEKYSNEKWEDLKIRSVKFFEIQALYIDYNVLLVSDLCSILKSFDKLYHYLYRINYKDEDEINQLSDTYYKYNALEFDSINTGNSIILKIKTGWTPSLDVKDGDFEVALPKAYVTLVFLGFIIHSILTNGIQTYDDLIEIDHKKLENEKLRFEIDELKSKAKLISDGRKNEIYSEMKIFHQYTKGNPNIKQIEISQSDKNTEQNHGNKIP